MVLLFPWISVAVHVTIVSPVGNSLSVWSCCRDCSPQLSDAPGRLSWTIAVHKLGSVLTVISVAAVMEGASVSLTITFCSVVIVFPLASVIFHTIVVSPTSKILSGWSFVIVSADAQLSVAIGGINVTTALHRPGSLLTVISAGLVTVGASVSVTITFCCAVVMCP